MNTNLPPIFISLKPELHNGALRPANSFVMLSLLCLALLSLVLITVSGANSLQLFGASFCFVLASFLAWRNARLAQAISQLSHSGNQRILNLHWGSAQAHTPPSPVHWLSFHRLGPLAWLRLGIFNDLAKVKSRKATIFIWQGTNPAAALQQEQPLREWARRWHTLSRMSDAPDFLPNN